MPSILKRFMRPSQESQSADTPLEFHAVGDVNEMGRMVNLVESANRARDASEAVGEILAVRENVEDTHEVISELNNDDQGMALETACSVAQQCNTLATMLGVESFRNVVNLDTLKPQGNVVSLEMFEAILPSLKAASDAALRESEGALNELTVALREALPEAKDRLCGLLAAVSVRRDSFATELELDTAVATGISTTAGLPQNLLNYTMLYAGHGATIVGPYLEKSKIMASQAQSILSGLSYESPEAFWKTFKERVEALGDPRSAFAEDRLEFELPGVGSLFDQGGADINSGNDVVRQVMEFVENHRPLTELQALGSVESNRLTAPSRDELENTLKVLIELHEAVDITAVFEAVRGTWKATQSAVAESREVIRNSAGATGFAVGNDIHLIPRYLKVVHELSVWPILNFLTNLVMFSNAIVAVSEAALNTAPEAPEAETPMEPMGGAEPVDGLDPTASDSLDGTGDASDIPPAEGIDDIPAPAGGDLTDDAELDPVPVAGDEMPLANDVVEADAAEAEADADAEADAGDGLDTDIAGDDSAPPADAEEAAADADEQEEQEEIQDDTSQSGELPGDIDPDASDTEDKDDEFAFKP